LAGTIVVGVDGSAHGREALRFALAEAALREGIVVAVHAWSIPPLTATGLGMIPAVDLLRDELADAARAALEAELAEALETEPATTVDPEVVMGDAGGALVERAEGADLLVVGSRGRGGVAGALLGSVSRACLHHAPCPVAVVHDAGPTERSRIVVGVDGSPPARVALEWAYGEARIRQAALYAVCAYDEPWALAAAAVSSPDAVDRFGEALARDAEQVLAAAAADAPERVAVATAAIEGAPGRTLVDAAAGSALLVVGSRGRGGFTSLLLGSVSEHCASRADGVVVVVRPRP
jgi:nucleotide-binding universal stress UspA family protein